MDDYQITFARSTRREMEKLDESVVNRIFPKIEKLAQNPRPKGCGRIRRDRNLWRIRIGDYRVIYAILEDIKVVDIIGVRHRSKAYEYLIKF